MFTTILCATDGTEHSDHALRLAAKLAREQDSRLHVVHVVERIMGGRLSGENVFLNEAEIDAHIRSQTSEMTRQTGVHATLHIVRGTTSRIAERLAAIAEELNADLIVVGTRGRSSLGGLLTGSVTPRLLHATTRPVLALPPTDTPDTALTPEEQQSAA
jgi:nucleotide-binding universal stress UspA family protein